MNLAAKSDDSDKDSSYAFGKEAVLEFADGGGFEAIVPVGVADKIDVIEDEIASLNMSDELSNLQEYAITTLNTGVIKVKGLIPGEAN